MKLLAERALLERDDLMRITSLIHSCDVLQSNETVIRLSVENSDFCYYVPINSHEKRPVFIFYGQGLEIQQRLIVKAALIESLADLNLTMSV